MPPQKRPTEAELALYQRYREHRADCRPKACTGAKDCWVEIGPPGYHHGACRRCGGYPRMATGEWRKRVE